MHLNLGKGRFHYQFALFSLALLPFLKVISLAFLSFDDGIHVYQNPLLGTFEWKNILALVSHPLNGLYIPVTYVSWSLASALSGLVSGHAFDPRIFHALNLVLHAANSVLVFQLLGQWGLSRRASLLGALLFAWHPLHVEPVAWVSGLKDLLSAFFILLALNFYFLRGNKNQIAAFILFLFALAAKPSAVVLAPLLIVVEKVIFKKGWLGVFAATFPYGIISGIVSGFSKSGQPDSWLSFHPNFWQRLVVALDSVGFYLLKLASPFGFTLNYGRSPHTVLLENPSYFYLGLGISILLSLLGLAFRHSKWFAGPGIFVISILPTAGLLLFYYQRFSTVADRFAYLALLGPSLVLGQLWDFKAQRNRLFLLPISMGLILFALISYKQVPIWSNDVSVLQNMVQYNGNAENHYNLARALTEAVEGRAYAPDAQGPKSLEPHPKTGEERIKLLTEIEKHYLIAVSLDGRYFQAYNNLGILKAEQGDWKSAEGYYAKAILLSPDVAESYNNLGVSLAARGEQFRAFQLFSKALELDPHSGDANYNLGLIYEQRKQYEQARTLFLKALQINPTSGRIQLSLKNLSASSSQAKGEVLK